MMMEFYFNKNKAQENSISLSDCYKTLDKYFNKRGVEKIADGIYKGAVEDFASFSIAAVRLPKTNWFLKIIDEWYWRTESDDVEDREDCLKTWYEYTTMKH